MSWIEIPEEQFPGNATDLTPYNFPEEQAEGLKNMKFFREVNTGEYRAYTSLIRGTEMHQVKITFPNKGNYASCSFSHIRKPYLKKYKNLPVPKLSPSLRTPEFKKRPKNLGKNKFFWDMYAVLDICENEFLTK